MLVLKIASCFLQRPEGTSYIHEQYHILYQYPGSIPVGPDRPSMSNMM
jgi:sucrose-6-phosphate hydrolase SacC (GH32 family)